MSMLQTLGRFRIDGVLGQGAMSVVYRAAESGDHPVALKVLRSELLAAAERSAVLARFEREARIGMRLNHPNIVRVFDYGQDYGCPWLAMELVKGRELKDFMEAEPPLPIERAVEIMLAVLDALACAHANGVVHRDVKPANIVLQNDGVPKVADFGIAQIPSSDVTQSGELLGTPAYVAPEQLRGEGTDGRADLFSAGVVLYYLLTRKRPFTGSVATVMQQILYHEPPPPSTVNPRVPASFDPVIMKALAKDPMRRHASAGELAAELRAALAAAPTGDRGADASSDPDAEETLVTRDRDTIATELEALLRAVAGTPLGERRLAEIGRLIEEWLTGAGGDAARFGLMLAEAGVEPLSALILTGVPAPRAVLTGGRADWMALVRLFARLKATLGRLGTPERAAMMAARIAMELSGAVLLYSNELNRELMADDNPDIMRLSADFMRLDILAMALEELGAETELRGARGTMLMFAGQVMRKVNSILRACTDGNDGFARFGVAVILSDIEDLIVMAGRVLETSPDGIGAFQAIGREIVVEFIELSRRFAALSIEELRALAGSAAPDAFAAKLRPVGALYAFATRLPAADGVEAMQALTADLHRHMGTLAVELARATDADAHARLESLHDMASGLGWTEIERMTVDALRRWALATGRAA